MKKNLAKHYLDCYADQAAKPQEQYFKEKIEQASFSPLLVSMLSSFSQMTALGKKIRGAMVVLGYDLAGGKNLPEILRTSLFIEIFHTGVLIHDDIIDRDDIRRGLPAIHKRFEDYGRKIKVKTDYSHYGQSIALILADASFYYSFELLLKSNFDHDLVLTAGQIYSDYVIRVCYGQALDTTNSSLSRVKSDEILTTLKYKTAEYTGVLPLLVGATLAGLKDKQKIKALVDYGLNFGWAFQIQDDVLGLFGNENETGKPVGSDIKEGKNTLLVYYLRKLGNQKQKQFLDKILGNQSLTVDQLDQLKTALKESGAYRKVIDLGWQYVKNGQREISKITSDKKMRLLLDSLINYMMERIA